MSKLIDLHGRKLTPVVLLPFAHAMEDHLSISGTEFRGMLQITIFLK